MAGILPERCLGRQLAFKVPVRFPHPHPAADERLLQLLAGEYG